MGSFSHLDLERIGNAASYVGCAQTVVTDAIRYAKQRVQFGKPIGQFQVIKHMLAQMQTEVDAARLLVYNAAGKLSRGYKATKEASMAKLFASEMLGRVASEGVQTFGGYGLIPEYDMERFYRDAKQATIGGGTSQIQRSIIAKQLGL